MLLQFQEYLEHSWFYNRDDWVCKDCMFTFSWPFPALKQWVTSIDIKQLVSLIKKILLPASSPLFLRFCKFRSLLFSSFQIHRVGMFPTWQGLNVKSLRAFRVLRPLRLLSSIPSENLSKFFAIQWSWAPNDFRFTNCDQRDHHGDDPSLQHHVARHVPHHHLRHHGARALQRHFPQELHQRHNRYHNLIEKDGEWWWDGCWERRDHQKKRKRLLN